MGQNENQKLYRELHSSFKSVNENLSHAECDLRVGRLWKSLREDIQLFPRNVKEEIKKLKDQFGKTKSTLDKFWNNIPKKKDTAPPPEVIEIGPQTNTSASEKNNTQKTFDEPHKTPKQTELAGKIASLSIDISYLETKKEKCLAGDDDLRRLTILKSEKSILEKKMRTLIGNQASAQRKRANDKAAFLELQSTNPDSAALLKKRSKQGRPRLEESQPLLLQTIVDIATYGSLADDKRSTNSIRSIKTLDELLDALRKLGHQISRNALYVRLLPKHSNSTEGKRHVVTVPVRLQRATYDFHKRHADTIFCKTTIRYLEELASILGPNQVLFISQDDKARVPIGKTAANKEAPILMHVEYRIRLPDHDWVVAEKHKLIPSVYAIIEISPKKLGDPTAVGYSGPTFICIRSGKHASSTAFSHARDLSSLFNNENFVEQCRQADGKLKPVVMITVDGGPDENPRYEKVQSAAIHHFKKYDLDAIFVATNAPGRSAFNRVERRMAPLSRELSGVILPHDRYGSHLNDQCKTIDDELEKRNFRHAGEVLAELWSDVRIDGCSTVATYVDPENSEEQISSQLDSRWRQVHVREGHYFFQVIKCNNDRCCNPMRGNLRKILSRFLPSPLTVEQNGLSFTDNSNESNEFPSLLTRLHIGDDNVRQGIIQEVPFDLCCPSVQELIPARTCKHCGLYHASLKNLKGHLKICEFKSTSTCQDPEVATLLISRNNRRSVRVAAQRQREKMVIWTSRLNDQHADWFDNEDVVGVEVETESNNEEISTSFPIFDISQHMETVWEKDT